MDASGRDGAAIVWISTSGCEGCTMAMLGATAPRIEELLAGSLTHIPTIELVHSLLAFDAGDRFIASLDRAGRGALDPFVLVVEGAPLDHRLAFGGLFDRLGPKPPEEWIRDLAPRAAATMAIGTCATAGGIPAAAGSVTGAMSLSTFLGEEYLSTSGLPIVNVPGCAPQGDAFIEALSYVFLHIGGRVPLDLDSRGRPRWLFDESTAVTNSDPLAPLLADCAVPSRGWINRIGGCASVGGSCVGCTRSDFPDLLDDHESKLAQALPAT